MPQNLSAQTNIASCAVGIFPIVTTSGVGTSFTRIANNSNGLYDVTTATSPCPCPQT